MHSSFKILPRLRSKGLGSWMKIRKNKHKENTKDNVEPWRLLHKRLSHHPRCPVLNFRWEGIETRCNIRFFGMFPEWIELEKHSREKTPSCALISNVPEMSLIYFLSIFCHYTFKSNSFMMLGQGLERYFGLKHLKSEIELLPDMLMEEGGWLQMAHPSTVFKKILACI